MPRRMPLYEGFERAAWSRPLRIAFRVEQAILDQRLCAPLPPDLMRGHTCFLKCSKRASPASATRAGGRRSNSCRTCALTNDRAPCKSSSGVQGQREMAAPDLCFVRDPDADLDCHRTLTPGHAHLVPGHELGLAGVAGARAREQGVHLRRRERRQQHGLPVAPRRAVEVPLPHTGHVRAMEGFGDAVEAVEHCARGMT